MTFGRGWHRGADDMAKHRHVGLARVCVVAAAAVGTLVVAAPAYAAGLDLTIGSANIDLSPSDSSKLSITLQNNDNAPSDGTTLQFNAPDGLSDLQVKANDFGCNSSGCVVGAIGPGKSKTVSFTLSESKNPGGVPAGGTKSG